MKNTIPIKLLACSLTLAGMAAYGPARAGTFSTDFSTQPARAQLFGDTGDGSAGVIEDGVLKVTKNVASQQGAFVIDDLDNGAPISGFTATFKLLIGGGSAADGFSFNFASDLPDGAFGEEGSGTGLTIAFDTYDNGSGEAPAIDVKWNGTVLDSTKGVGSLIRANKFLNIRVNVDSDGTLDLSVDNTVIQTNFPGAFLPTAGRFGFGARTGGSADNHFVDDVVITTSTAPGTQPRNPLVTAVSPKGQGAAPNPVIGIQVKDFTAQLTTSTVKLALDGASVTPTVTKTGDTTSIQYTVPTLLAPLSTHTFTLIYGDNGTPAKLTTNQWSFTVQKFWSVNLPAPIYLEKFDAVEEGSLPAGWTETNKTDSLNAGLDLTDPNSDSFLGWTVIERMRVEAGGTFDPRRLNVSIGYLNGKLATNLVEGKFLYAESDNRGGNQMQTLFSPDFNLTGKTDVCLSFNSIYEQNQDSIAAVEYSIDEGKTWLPILIMLEEADVVRDTNGVVNAAATLTTVQADTPQVDDGSGGTRRTAYGEFVASKPLESLGPYIDARVNDNPIESKRIEFFRLPKADNQAKVRFRFVQAGTGSWYFGIDNFGLYSVPSATGPDSSKRTYSLGLNFGTDQPSSSVAAGGVGGIAGIAQGNWNNLSGASGTNSTIVADAGGKADATSARVTWTSANTWASTGAGEENNKFATNSVERAIMTGYLDTGNATTTTVSISGLPAALTGGGYDVYVYAMGGVGGRGGAYRILDGSTKTVLKNYVKAQSPTNATAFAQVPVPPASGTHGAGNYIVFTGLSASSLTIEATTAGTGNGFSATPRAPINAIQIVTPPSSTPPPALSIARTVTGLTVNFTGTLQSADAVTGPWVDVSNAASPLNVTASGSAKFYRARK